MLVVAVRSTYINLWKNYQGPFLKSQCFVKKVFLKFRKIQKKTVCIVVPFACWGPGRQEDTVSFFSFIGFF